MTRRVFFFSLLTMIFLTACGSTASDIKPPAAQLTIDGKTQVAGVGTFCWQEKNLFGQGAGLCADMIGIPTSPDPLKASVGAQADLKLPIADAPAGLFVSVIPVAADGAMEAELGDNSWWQYQQGEPVEAQLAAEQRLTLDFEPGLYLISVQARWDELGDVMYGFLVELN